MNIFEETILRLTAAGLTDPAELARLTCLEPGLVAAIQRRLAALRRWDAGQRPLSGPAAGEAAWESAHVFIDLIGGRLLPCMSYGTPEYAEPLDAQGATFRLGGARFNAILLEHGRDHAGNVPSPREVHAVARIRMRQDARRAGADAAIPRFDTPTVMAGVETVHLAASAVLQAGNHDDVLLMDPFGFGPCGALSEVFRQARASHPCLRKATQALLEDARVAGVRRGAGLRPKPAGRYPDVSAKMAQAGKALAEAGGQVRDTGGARKAARAKGQCLHALYEALELGLHAAVLERPAGKGLRGVLANQSYAANGDLLWSYAMKLGLRGDERERGLLQVAAGKFRDHGAASVELGPLLALALGAACAERDSGHPLRTVAQAHPHLLGTLLQLKRYRDTVAHGGQIPALHQDAIAAHHAVVCSILALLLPGWRVQEGTANAAEDDHRWRHQARLRARLAADAALAPASLDHLPEQLRLACIELELLRDSASAGEPAGTEQADEPDASAMVNALATMLQLALEECLSGRRVLAPGGDWSALALEKARKAGFALDAGQLPQPLRSVAVRRLARAMNGDGATLQSGAMALLIVADDTYLAGLASGLPGFVALAGELAALRGHGYLTRPVTWTELAQWREHVYHNMIHLTEILING